MISVVALYDSLVVISFISIVLKFKKKTFVMDPVKIIYSRLDIHFTILTKKS